MCRHYKADELLAMGALNRVVKPDALMPAARELAKTMAAKSREYSRRPSVISMPCSSATALSKARQHLSLTAIAQSSRRGPDCMNAIATPSSGSTIRAICPP